MRRTSTQQTPAAQQQVRTAALVTSSTSHSTGVVRAKLTASLQKKQQQAIDVIKTPPSSKQAPSTRNSSSSSSTPASLSLKKKVDDVFTRIQPHTIVQSYEKLLGGLKITPTLTVNGETLAPLAAVPATLTAGWKAAVGEKALDSHLAATFEPQSGRFHYARCLQYAPSDPMLSLTTIKTLQVSLTSAMNRSSAIPISRLPASLSKKLWCLTAESTNKQIGLALYELPLGDWQHSSLVVLVWTQTLEIVKFYLQLNIAELLYTTIQRPIKVAMDDVDPKYGLQSYIMAITIRTFDKVLWEKEFYGVALENDSKRAQVVSVELLDDANNGYRDRERYLSTPDAALPVATDAITYAMDNVLIVDLNVWEGSSSACTPVWGLSKPLPVIQKSDNVTGGGFTDFSLSAEEKQSLVLLYQDASRGNGLTIALEKLNCGSSKKLTRVFIKQIELTFSLRFIDATFDTSHAASSSTK